MRSSYEIVLRDCVFVFRDTLKFVEGDGYLLTVFVFFVLFEMHDLRSRFFFGHTNVISHRDVPLYPIVVFVFQKDVFFRRVCAYSESLCASYPETGKNIVSFLCLFKRYMRERELVEVNSFSRQKRSEFYFGGQKSLRA